MPVPNDLTKHASPLDATRSAPGQPAWADGIRIVYDAVTYEALPADFQALLLALSKIELM